ncbi:hypothetical protein N7522_005337 [Penicillium canescens]|nr:hypothetical protein N7522_005337 [Penicillium canescens]
MHHSPSMHHLAPLVLPPGPVNFIHVDPTNPQRSPPERRPRSKAKIDKQKADSSALRKAGGACLWCMRSRKRCVPQSPCNLCYTSEQRICIREAEHLYLFGKPPGSPFPATRLPSVEGRLTLEEMERTVFSETTEFQAVLSVCQKDTFLGSRAWIVTKSKSDLMENETLVDSFIDMAISCLDCAELSEMEASYSSNPLVRKALQMARLFMTTRCMAKTRIFAPTADVASGRLVMFFVLVRCVRRLAEMSWALCFLLYESLRHKDMGDYEPKTNKDLDPVWVATALYIRTANGLNALRDNPAIEKILGPGCQIDVICQVIGNILDHTFPRQKYISTSRIRGTFEAAIPELSSPSPSFDIVFLQGPSDRQWSCLPPESCYLMTTFLSAGFPPSDSPLPRSSEVVEALIAISASPAAPIGTTQDAENDSSFVNLDSTISFGMLQDADEILGADTLWRSGSLETFGSTDSTETLPELPDTVPGDWALTDPSIALNLDIFDTISGNSSYCSCCSYCCDHDADADGCCCITECSPGKCYCPYGRSPC